jgi:hypothetical protein
MEDNVCTNQATEATAAARIVQWQLPFKLNREYSNI